MFHQHAFVILLLGILMSSLNACLKRNLMLTNQDMVKRAVLKINSMNSNMVFHNHTLRY